MTARSALARRFMAAIRDIDPRTMRSTHYTGPDHRAAIDQVEDSALRDRLETLYRSEDPANVGFMVDGRFHNRQAGLEALRAMRSEPRRQRVPPEAILRELRRQIAAQPRRTVSWSPERVDALIEAYGRQPMSDGGRVAATISPDDFLRTTTGRDQIKRIVEEEVLPLDERMLALGDAYIHGLADDTPLLVARTFDGKRIEVRGHEGRHRNTAMGLAGARRVPVVLHPQHKSSFEPFIGKKKVRIHPDHFAEGEGMLHDITPITPENREALLNLGVRKRSPNHIVYGAGLAATLASILSQREEEAA